MSTFFEVLQGRIREKQLFSEMFITLFCPTYAQPAKDIGFYIVSLVGKVIFNFAAGCCKIWMQTVSLWIGGFIMLISFMSSP